MTEEIIKDVIGFEGLYKISDKGYIFSLERTVRRSGNTKRIIKGRKLKARISGSYYCVTLHKHAVKFKIQVHRLLLMNFKEPVLGKKFCNHIDGNKLNNNLENLEWCTLSENTLHSYHVLNQRRPKSWLGKFGKDHIRSKPIISINQFGEIERHESILQASKKLNVSDGNISCVLKGKRSHTKNYTFKYVSQE